MANIVHLTTVHSRKDVRIFLKQCRSLANNGHTVTLVVADGKGDEVADGVRVIDAGHWEGRLSRMTRSSRAVLKRALQLNADIYHMHDPELLPIGLSLKRKGHKVIFDAHEDVPKQLLNKPYLGPRRLRWISKLYAKYERHACARFDMILAATPTIRDKFLAINPITQDINNFPILNELDDARPWASKLKQVCYAGGIQSIRGIRELVCAMNLVRSPVRLSLAGRFAEPEVEREVRALPGWRRMDYLGFIGREELRQVLGRSMAGLVTFHPLQNHLDAQPNKMFEYMSAGLPVIASDFPLWKEIVEGNDCGICVDPTDPRAIASAIEAIISDPKGAERMGQNGRKAVLEKYNWRREEAKLLACYLSALEN